MAGSAHTTSLVGATKALISAVGSGSMFARIKKLYRADMDESAAVTACVEALYDAADDDSATGGPDLYRAIYPIVAVVDIDGVRKPMNPRWQASLSGWCVRGRRHPMVLSLNCQPDRGVAHHVDAFLRISEQLIKDKADYARKGSLAGVRLLSFSTATASCSSPRT